MQLRPIQQQGLLCGVTRRQFGLGATALALSAPRLAFAAGTPDLVLILMADLHSGYAYSAALVQAVRDVVEANKGADVVIVVNGDVFESGNVLGQRNQGKIDLAILRSFVSLAPTLVNIGNHDGDLFDPEDFVADVKAMGAMLITDIIDPRTKTPYGPAGTQFRSKGRLVKVSAIGTPALGSYRNGQAWYAVPQPGEYAAANFNTLFADADFHLALVHAGFKADMSVLPATDTPFVLHGGHDHLRFTQAVGTQGLHIQSGYWSNGFAVVGVTFGNGGVTIEPQQVQLTRTSRPDAGLQALIDAERKALLTDADLKVLGHMPKEMLLDDAVLFAADAVRKAARADIGFLSHTTFGDGLPAGAVTPFDLAGFVRFDGGFAAGDVDGALLADTILPRCNQFGTFPYEKRTGDFLYASPAIVDRSKKYRIVVNSFAASSPASRQDFFGTPDVAVEAVPDLMLKAIVAGALPT